MGENLRQVSKEIGSEQIPKSTIAALMPGSESNYGQTAKHRQYCECCEVRKHPAVSRQVWSTYT